MRRRQAFKSARPTKVLNRGLSDFLKEKSAAFGGNRVPPLLNWGYSGFFPTPYRGRLIGKFLDGRIVTTGGLSGSNQTDVNSADTQLFVADGTSFGNIAALPNVTNPVSGGSACMATLGDGRIMVAGGGSTGRDVVTLDPGSLLWTSRPAMAGASVLTGFTLTTLANGNILRVGGSISSSRVSTVEEYIQGSNTWTSRGALGSARSNHSAVLLSNGKVLVAGGAGSGDTTTEIYDPTAHVWAPTFGNLQAGNEGQSSLTLSNGKTLLTCVVFTSSFTILADLYDPLTDNFTQLASLPNSYQSSGGGGYLIEIGAGFIALIDAAFFARSSFYDLLKDEWTEIEISPEPLAGTFIPITKNTMLIASGQPDSGYVRPHAPHRYITLSTLGRNDLVPPTFGGIVSVEQGTTTDRVVLHWAAATDPKTHSEDINYLVYLALAPGGETFGPLGSEFANTSAWAGSKSIELYGLTPDTDYYFVVRSIDMLVQETAINEATLACNIDTNVVEVLFHTALTMAAPTFSWTATDDQTTPRTDARGLKLTSSNPNPNGDPTRFMIVGGGASDGDIYTQTGKLERRQEFTFNAQRDFVTVDGDVTLSDGQESRRPAVFGGVDQSNNNVAEASKYYPYWYQFFIFDGVHQNVPDMNEQVSRHAGVGLLSQDLLRIGGLTIANDTTSATNTVERMRFSYCQQVNYFGTTVDFTVGATLTGLTSGCTGTIQQITPSDPTSGVMLVSDVTTFYVDTEELTDSDGGDGFASGFSFGNFVSQVWVFCAPMTNKRYYHSAINLDDGRVLVAGGFDETSTPVLDIEIYDPVANTWSLLAGVAQPHSQFPLVKLLNSKVLLIGGDQNLGGNSKVDIFDPAGPDTVTAGADLPNSRLRHTAHMFGDGQVGVFGGQDPSSGFGMNDVQLYNPGSDTWTAKAHMLTARAGHVSFLLPNNTVLVVGGTDDSGTILASAEISGP